jgi:hypothetical protein
VEAPIAFIFCFCILGLKFHTRELVGRGFMVFDGILPWGMVCVAVTALVMSASHVHGEQRKATHNQSPTLNKIARIRPPNPQDAKRIVLDGPGEVSSKKPF